MKRYWNILGCATICLSLCGVVLSLLIGKSQQTLELIARICFVGSIVGFIGVALLRPKAYQMNGSGGDIGLKASAASNYTFGDIAANAEAQRSLAGMVDYLKNPEKYARYGARMPRGVLLYGPPGTGKTLLAKALAGEAGVPFFALSGSDFVQMYVGVGAGRVRELFKNARKAGKCVIFIDEIDAMGKRRDQASSDERDQTLNALLSEMSGFRDAEGIIVLAATNRLDTLDPALLRPGRFDRQIEVGLPGKKERLSILKLHSKNKPISDAVDLEALALETSCFSGASLENLLNEAAISAAARDAQRIEDADIQRAFIKTVAGFERESVASHEEKCTIALHEAGHAIAIKLLMPEHSLKRVSILPAGNGAAGYNLSIPPERVMIEKKDIEHQVQVLLAGRAAELMIGGESALTSGASNDLQRAGELVSAMVLDLGMAGQPAVALRTLMKTCGGTSDAADQCKQMLAELYSRTEALLCGRADDLLKLTRALTEREVLTSDEVDEILGSKVA